ncbi:MAG: trehalose-6-phosphate synthase [Alphaproteobacteria bacterium]
MTTSSNGNDQTPKPQPLTIYAVQDPPPSLLKTIKAALAKEGQEDAYPRNRNTFWFEQAFQHLAKAGTNYELVIPYQLPKNAANQEVPQALQDIGKQHRIHWVPVPHEVVEGHVRMDNDGWKAGFHGLEYNAPFSKKDYECSQEFSRLMARAVADRVEAGHQATGDIVGVNLQNRYMCLVPGQLNEEMRARNKRDTYVSTYFSHIDQTHKIDVFVKTPEIKAVVASLLEADAVNFHTPQYGDNFRKAVKKLFPDQVKIDDKNSAITYTRDGETRTVKTGSHFLGIDVERWQRHIASDQAWEHAKEYLDMANGRQILFAFDRCDPIKALDHRMEIVDKFLDQNPNQAKNVVLMQVCYLANDTPREYEDVYRKLFNTTNAHVARINAKFVNAHGKTALPPAINLPKLSEPQIAGLVIAATISGGVNVVSSIAEGLHMGKLESYAANAYLSENNGARLKELAQKHGVPLNKKSGALAFWTSTVAGVEHYVKGAFPMHPEKKDSSARTLRKAVKASEVERAFRMEKSISFVRTNTSAEWIKSMDREMRQLRRDKHRSLATPPRRPPPASAQVAAYTQA